MSSKKGKHLNATLCGIYAFVFLRYINELHINILISVYYSSFF
jgi:hypothetical protein